jgi:hypothetical protein
MSMVWPGAAAANAEANEAASVTRTVRPAPDTSRTGCTEPPAPPPSAIGATWAAEPPAEVAGRRADEPATGGGCAEAAGGTFGVGVG